MIDNGFLKDLLKAMDLIIELNKTMENDREVYKHIKEANLNNISKEKRKSYHITKSCFKDINTTNFLFQSRTSWNTEEELKKEPKKVGLANSINIKVLAEEKGWKECCKCNSNLEFDENKGWFECTVCEHRGGIRKLVEDNLK